MKLTDHLVISFHLSDKKFTILILRWLLEQIQIKKAKMKKIWMNRKITKKVKILLEESEIPKKGVGGVDVV